MSIKIEISEEHVKQLMEFYIQRLKVLKDEIQEREIACKELNETIQKLRKASSNEPGRNHKITPNTKDYNESWPWFRKIEYAIKYKKKALSTREVVDTLSEYEPSFLYNRKKAVASISSVLSTQSGKGKKFIRKQNDIGEFIYTLAANYDTISNGSSRSNFADEPPF